MDKVRQTQPHMLNLDDLSGDHDDLQKIYSIKHECELIINYMLNEKGSLRQCADNIGLSTSNIHRKIHSYIKHFYDEEYCQIVHILKFNSENRRKPRKYWRGRPW